MRSIMPMLVLALSACGSGSEHEERPAETAPAAAAQKQSAAALPSATPAGLMPIPEDPKALKRLAAMGYTIHKEQGHLHAPGLTSCPAMGDGPAM